MIRIVMAGEPIGKGRPRFSRATGTVYTPEKTARYEERLAWAAQRTSFPLTETAARAKAHGMTEATTPETDPAALVSALLRLLDVADKGGDRFEGARKVGGVGRVFGGQVIAQALAAAERTVSPDRPVHSLHAYLRRTELDPERLAEGG